MAESQIVAAIISGLSSSDPSLTATPNQTARIDVNCNQDKSDAPLVGISSILFPFPALKVIPSGGCIIEELNVKGVSDSSIDTKVASFKKSLEVSLKGLGPNEKNLVFIKKEIIKKLYDNFVIEPITNNVPSLPNVYLYNYEREYELDKPGRDEINLKYKKMSDMFFIPSDAIFGIFEVIKELNLFLKISGMAVDFASFGSPILKTKDNLVKLMLEFVPFFNYTNNEIKGLSGAALEPRFHGGYFTVFQFGLIAKLPDLSGRNYRGNINSFYEDFEPLTVMQLHYLDKTETDESKQDSYKNVTLDIEKVFNAEILSYESSYQFGSSLDSFEITITGVNLDVVTDAYLSYIEPITFPEPIGYNDTKKSFIDFQVCPNIEKYIDRDEARATLTTEQEKYVNLTINSKLSKVFNNTTIENFKMKESGTPASQFGVYNFGYESYDNFALLSRQDELLASNQDKGLSIRRPGIQKNWNSSKSMNSSTFGIQTTPRIYKEHTIPKSWFIGTISPQDEDTYVLTFKSSDLNSILSNKIEFSVYLSDSKGQINRISNKSITLERSAPSITVPFGDGFRESGVLVYPGYKIRISGEGFIEGKTTAMICGQKAAIEDITPTSANVTVPATVGVGECDLVISNGVGYEETEKVYISLNASSDIFAAPRRSAPKLKIIGNSIRAENIGEIPISYDSPTSSIELISKKFTFMDELLGDVRAYLFVETNDNDFINFLSNDYIKIGNLYIFNDISYQLSENSSDDFYKSSMRKVVLKFPGNGNTSRPLRALLNLENNGSNDVGVIITTEGSASSIKIGTNSLKASFKVDGVPFFSDQPTIFGMAGSTNDFDAQKTTYFRNFDPSLFGNTRSDIEKVINEELFDSSSQELDGLSFGPISSISLINDLIIFFKSVQRDEFPQKYTFFVAGKKASIFKTRNVEKVADLKNGAVWKAVISDVDTASLRGGYGNVAVRRKDRKRKVELGSENIYIDITSPNGISDLAKEVTVGRNTSLQLNKELSIPTIYNEQVGAISYGRSGNAFGISTLESSLFGNLVKDLSGEVQLIDFDAEVEYLIKQAEKADTKSAPKPFYKINIESLNSNAKLFFGPIYEERLIALGIKEIKNNITIGLAPTELRYLPAFVKFEAGQVVTNYHLGTGDYEGTYKTFHRLKITNNVTILSNLPKIVSVEPDSFSAGKEVVITVEKMNTKKIKVYVNTTRARIKSSTDTTITILAPEDVDGLHLLQGQCQEIIIKPSTRTLLGAELDLGVTFVNDALKAITDSINGFISDKMGDVQALIDRIKEKFLRFISLRLDKVNIAKELINSFCDMSFHLTAELNIYLKNFSILLIPVKVIFCIIDVICSLLNPAQLAPAIVRLFECLYDLLLLLPPIAVPVLVLQLFLHLLELLECLITKIQNTISIIGIVILAIGEVSNLISGDKEVDFKYLMMLEGILLDNFLTIDADLQVLGPIVQILAIILQIMQLVFRFPCNLGSQTLMEDCGINGTMLAGFITATITNEDGTLKTEYLLPVAQDKPKASVDEMSDKNTKISEIRASLFSGDDDIDKPAPNDPVITKSDDESFFDKIEYNDDNFRFNSNKNVSFSVSFTKVIKRLREPQKSKFVFNNVAAPSLFRRRVDFNAQMDSPITLLNLVNNNNLSMSNETSQRGRNIYSMLDAEEFINIKSEGGKIIGNVKQLTLPIEVDGTTYLRTFADIPKMVLMDEQSNFYYIDEDGIEFNDELKIDTISARIINTNTSPDIDYSRDSQEVENDDGTTESVTIFRFPKLHFVDVRAAAEIIQTQIATCSTNNFLMEISDPDETTRIVQEASDCLNAFIDGITSEIKRMRALTEIGKIPEPFKEDFVNNLANELILCINRGVNDICPQVINQLNTSFKILEDDDETPLGGFPDQILPEEIMQGFQTDGPPLTGAREYAAGIGDAATIKVKKEATIEIIPRDSYDEIIIEAYDLSDRTDIQIISDTTGSARIVKKQHNGRLKDIVPDGFGKYYSYITANNPGKVKIKAKICNKVIQAITYAGLESIVAGGEVTGIDCIPDSAESVEDRVIPLGAQVRVNRILTITFIDNQDGEVVISNVEGIDLDASPANSGMFAIGDN